MRTATKLAILAAALRAITYVIRRQRAIRQADQRRPARDVRPRVTEPLEL